MDLLKIIMVIHIVQLYFFGDSIKKNINNILGNLKIRRIINSKLNYENKNEKKLLDIPKIENITWEEGEIPWDFNENKTIYHTYSPIQVIHLLI